MKQSFPTLSFLLVERIRFRNLSIELVLHGRNGSYLPFRFYLRGWCISTFAVWLIISLIAWNHLFLQFLMKAKLAIGYWPFLLPAHNIFVVFQDTAYSAKVLLTR